MDEQPFQLLEDKRSAAMHALSLAATLTHRRDFTPVDTILKLLRIDIRQAAR